MKITAESLIEQLKWRYATKKFDPKKKIAPQDFEALKEALRLSPSSYGLQPWLFISVDNAELRQKLRQVSYQQSQVTDASHYVVLAYLHDFSSDDIDRHLRQISTVTGTSLEQLAGFRKSMVGDLIEGPRSQDIQNWAKRQVYIAMGFVLLAAAELRIDACPMEGIIPQEYDQLLGLTQTKYRTLAAVALGYRDPADPFARQPKVRFSSSEIWKVIS